MTDPETASDNIEGQWLLTRIKTDTNQRIPSTKGVMFSLNIEKDGKAYGKVACNHWHGGYDLTDHKLQISKAATTKKLCIIKDPLLKTLEGRFLIELKNPITFKASDIELALNISEQETWFFTAQTK